MLDSGAARGADRPRHHHARQLTMRNVLWVHIASGTIGLLTGYIALAAAKGAVVHRRSGIVFVYTMLAMCLGGLAVALVRSVAPEINVPAALLTAYLVITALTTLRPESTDAVPRMGAIALMLVALGVGTIMTWFAIEAFANGGTRNGMPAFPFVMFATVGLLGFAGDVRVMRGGARKGTARIARHLWRMSFALFLAALSFSVQAAKILSRQGIKVPGIAIALPMLVVLVAMVYWLWRVRMRRSLQGIALLRAQGVATT
jgi:hypothetical protein